MTLAWMLASRGAFPDAGDAGTVATFASRAEPAVGLTLTLLSQGGFWREAPGRSLPGGAVWVLATAATWGVAAVGAVRAVAGARAAGSAVTVDGTGPDAGPSPDRVDARAGVTAGVLVVAGALALLAAHGTAGPAGSAYAVALDRVPGFAVMREPGKFVAVVSLALAVCFASGIDRLVRVPAGGRAVLVARAAAAALVLAVVAGSWPLAGGLGGRVRPTAFPAAWHEARTVLDQGSGPVLVVPPGTYLDPGFTDGRIVANPAPGWFGPDVVVIDDPGVPGLQARGERERTVAAALRDAPRPTLHADLLRAGFTRVLALDGNGVAAVRGDGSVDPPGFVERFRSGDVVVWELRGGERGPGTRNGAP